MPELPDACCFRQSKTVPARSRQYRALCHPLLLRETSDISGSRNVDRPLNVDDASPVFFRNSHVPHNQPSSHGLVIRAAAIPLRVLDRAGTPWAKILGVAECDATVE